MEYWYYFQRNMAECYNKGQLCNWTYLGVTALNHAPLLPFLDKHARSMARPGSMVIRALWNPSLYQYTASQAVA